MLIFTTSSTEHLAAKLPFKKGKYIIKQFSDHEIYVKIEENVANKEVIVLANTISPATNILEFFFLLDALTNAKAKIRLIIPYFGYARQDRINKGEAFTSRLIINWLNGFKLKEIYILHIHSKRLEKFFDYKNFIPLKLYCSIAEKFDLLIAPDKGAIPLVEKIGIQTKIKTASMKKYRPKHEKVKLSLFNKDIKGQHLLIIEDMISTANTIIEATKMLLKQGAKDISVLATHGIFANNAIQRINKSPIKKIYVTNSITQKKGLKKIETLDIIPYLIDIIRA